MRRSKDVPRYRFERYLCTAAEWRFHAVLKKAVGERFDIMLQVRVAAVLRPRQGAAWVRDGRRVSQKAFDFVLVDKGTSRVRAAFELDDRTHGEPERQRRDQFLEGACERAGLPLGRIQVERRYCVERVRKRVDETLAQKRGDGESQGRPRQNRRRVQVT